MIHSPRQARAVAAVGFLFAFASAALAGDGKLADSIASAPANQWIQQEAGQTAGREAPLLRYAASIDGLVRASGKTGGLKGALQYRHYDTELLDLATLKWINAYPADAAAGRPASGPIGEKPWSLTSAGKGELLHKDGESLRIGNQWIFDQAAVAGDSGRIYVYDDKLVSFDPRTRQWTNVSGESHPGGARWSSLCYDPVNKELLQVGGHGAPFGNWVFSLESGKWRSATAASEALRSLHDQSEKLLWQAKELVGRSANRFTIAETDAEAKVDLRAVAGELAKAADALRGEIAKAKLADHEKPAGAFAADLLTSTSAAVTKAGDRLSGKLDAELLGELRALQVQCDRVRSALSPDPSPRGLTQAAYDPAGKQIVVFGGDAHDRVLNDTWLYDCATRTWRQQFPKLSPPPRAGHLLRYLPAAGKFVLAGGYSRRGLASDLWSYEPASNTWRLIKLLAGNDPSPKADNMGYPLAGDVVPGDVLVAMEPKGKTVWTCRIDASQSDAEGQAKIAAAPVSFTFHGIDPAAWEAVAAPDAARMEKFFKDLPPNQWTAIPFAKYAPGARNRWGTTAYDPQRRQFLLWGGGHATSMEDDVAHFSLRGGCWTVSYWPDAPLNRGSYMSWSGISFSRRPAMPGWHAYQAYECDPSGRMFYLDRAYDVVAREWQPQPYPGLEHGSFARSAVEYTPHGVVCYSGKGFFRFDAGQNQWVRPKWEGPQLAKVFCDSTAMCYDSTRDCMYLSDHDIIRYDFKTGQAVRLGVNPPKFINSYGQVALMRECVHIPEADLVLVWKAWSDGQGKRRQVGWDPKTLKYYWVDLPWVNAEGKPAAMPELSWHDGIAYDQATGTVLLNDSRTRAVWALRFDRKTAGLAEIVVEPEQPQAAQDK